MGAYSAGVAAAVMPWTWTVRDPTLVEYDGQIDGYDSAQVDLQDPTIDSDGGTWSITLPTRHWAASALSEEGAGVVIRPAAHGAPIASGSWETWTEQTDGQRSTLTFTGPVDDTLLAGELAWADPAHDLNDLAGNNPVADAADIRTGPAETVLKAFINANVKATSPAFRAARLWPWLDVPATAGLGTTVTLRGQFTSLLDIARQAASPTTGITWSIRQQASGVLRLLVRERVDRSPDVVFSHAEGTLTKSTLVRRRPAVTQAVAVSTNEGTRTFATVTDAGAETTWLRRFVQVVDGNSDVIADLTAAAAEAITAGREKAGLTAEPVQITGGPRFNVDYFLGDYVGAVSSSGHAFSDLLTGVGYRHDSGSKPTLTPSIGVNAIDETDALVPIVRDLTRTQRRNTGRS